MTIQLPGPGVYRIDPTGSRIAVRAKHRFGTGTVRGTFELTGGEIAVAVPHEGSTVRADASAASFESGSSARDRNVRSRRFLDAEAHPAISFTSTAFDQVDGVWHLRGTLTARGVTAAADFAVESLELGATDLLVSATARVDRYAHGITAAKGMAGRHLELTVTARATRQA
ncbi:MAG: YceI family protein [Nocardioidaceae bacterium]|nr:YceI family protein [Nocardioidaceae bacterium]